MSNRTRFRRAAAFALLSAILWTGGSPPIAGAETGSAPDEAGKNIVTIDAADAFILENEAAYWVVDTSAPTIPITLDAPSIGIGSVDFVTLINPGIGTVYFEPGQQDAAANLQFYPGPPDESYEGWGAKWAYFALTQTTGGIFKGEPSTLYFVYAYETGPPPALGGGPDCLHCFVDFLECTLNIGVCDGDCLGGAMTERQPAAPRAGGDAEGTAFRRYRDEILMTTADGQYYVDLYNELSTDAIQAVVTSPSLLARMFKAKPAWVAGFQALVDGQGGSFVVTQQMEDDLNALLQTFEDVGSPNLAQKLAFERGRLQLDQIAGLTMAQYQDQVEDLGGPTSVDPVSWGRLKALYR